MYEVSVQNEVQGYYTTLEEAQNAAAALLVSRYGKQLVEMYYDSDNYDNFFDYLKGFVTWGKDDTLGYRLIDTEASWGNPQIWN